MTVMNMADENDPLDGLFDGASGAPEAAAEAPAEPAATEVAADPAEPAAEAPAGQGEPAAEPKMVPIEALHEARRRAQEAEERLSRVGTPAKEGEEQAPPPRRFRDPKEDPEGFAEDVFGNVQMNLVNQTINMSERFARKEHGDELIDKVRDWALAGFDNDPAFAQRVLTDPDPYGVAITEYNRHVAADRASKLPQEVLEGLDDEELAMLRSHRAAKQAATTPSGGSTAGNSSQPRDDKGQFQAPPPRRQVEAPPASLTDAPGTSRRGHGAIPTGQGVAFGDTFG
jgi:hypothetical protein